MAAVAYKVTLIAALGNPSGERKIFPLTASDVDAAFWLFPSGANEMVLHGSRDVYIIDAIYSAAGTDTTSVDIFLSGVNTGVRILNATSLATTINRPFNIAPFRVPAGTMVKFKQNT